MINFTESDLYKAYQLTKKGYNFTDVIESIKIDKLGTGDGDKIKVLYKTICNFYNINENFISGDNRCHNVVEARRMFCYLSRTLTNKGLNYIGLKINRDHATVLHHFRKQAGFVEIGDKNVISDVDELTTNYFKNLEVYKKEIKEKIA